MKFQFDLDQNIVLNVIQKVQQLRQEIKFSTSQVYFKRKRRDSWKNQVCISQLTYEDIATYHSNNKHCPFELRTEIDVGKDVVVPARAETQPFAKKCLSIDYYGCIQMEDAEQAKEREYTEMTLRFHKHKLLEVLEILGLIDVIE